jgi:hypothetical protein
MQCRDAPRSRESKLLVACHDSILLSCHSTVWLLDEEIISEHHGKGVGRTKFKKKRPMTESSTLCIYVGEGSPVGVPPQIKLGRGGSKIKERRPVRHRSINWREEQLTDPSNIPSIITDRIVLVDDDADHAAAAWTVGEL